MYHIVLLLFLGHTLHISTSKRIHCAATNEKNPKVKVETCEPGVEHCLTFLHRVSENYEYVQQPFGCMPWDELLGRCPSTTGVCNILHKEYEHKTCCCWGSMCNNRTLRLIMADDSNDPTTTLSGNLAKFGIIPRNSHDVLHSSMDNCTAHQSIFYSVSIGAVLLFVVISFCIVMTIRYEAGESPGYKMYSVFCFKRKTSGATVAREFSNQNEGQSNSITGKARRRSLIYRMLLPSPTSTTTPLLMSDETVGMSNSHLSSVHCDVPLYPLANASMFGDFAKLHSAEKIAMQHIVEGCQKMRLLGHGRFAEVWLASLSDSVVRQSLARFQSVLGGATGEKAGPADAEASIGHPVQAFDTGGVSSGSSADEHNQLPLHQPLSSQLAATTDHDPPSEHAPKASWSQPAADDYHTANVAATAPSPDYSNEIAIKIFSAADFKSWSAELSIFRALQQPIGYRLLSASDAEKVSFSDLLCGAPSGVPCGALGGEIACPSTRKSCPTVSESADHPVVSECCLSLSGQSRQQVNLIQMIAAGVMNEASREATLLREHRLVLEFAAGGSLRSLLSSRQWLSTSRMLRLARDIARGLSLLHSDVSHERSALRGSPAKLPIAHRDLKPENILLRANGVACLSDFGQATMVATDAASASAECHQQLPCRETAKTSQTWYWSSDVFSSLSSQSPSAGLQYGHCSLDCMPQAGTLRYMAPELLDGAINFTGGSLLRTDIYSLGLVLWEVMTAVHVPDHQHHQPRAGQVPSRSDGKWLALPAEEVEEGETESLSDTATCLCEEVFGQGFRVLPGDWQASCSVPVPPQRQHCPPSASLGVPLREHHRLPYELELESASTTASYYQEQQQPTGSQASCPTSPSSLLLLRQLVVVDKCRPMANYLWAYYTVLSKLYCTVTECWDPEPDARLTADCVLERINTLLELLKRHSASPQTENDPC